MSVGLVGRKCGMTRVFTDAGESIPVTVIEITPNRVSQIKTVETDGYRAMQVTAGQRPASRVNKPMAGHLAKASVEAGDIMHEHRLGDGEMEEAKAGDQLTVELFEAGQKVDVRGVSKGKGFAGAVKRYNFKMQDATHGNSLSHRALGSVGQCQTPGRVFKGKKMAGQMGNVNRCAQNQEIVRVDLEQHIILVKGAIPGAPGGIVVITPSVKMKRAK
jgi:large subunit ribosomal protein L3